MSPISFSSVGVRGRCRTRDGGLEGQGLGHQGEETGEKKTKHLYSAKQKPTISATCYSFFNLDEQSGKVIFSCPDPVENKTHLSVYYV